MVHHTSWLADTCGHTASAVVSGNSWMKMVHHMSWVVDTCGSYYYKHLVVDVDVVDSPVVVVVATTYFSIFLDIL